MVAVADCRCGRVSADGTYSQARGDCWPCFLRGPAPPPTISTPPAPVAPADRYLSPPCASRGKPTGEVAECQTCTGRHPIPVLACAVHGRCHTTGYTTDRAVRCLGCPSRSESPPFEAKPGDPAAGVVIGSYQWPELVDLQVRVIRSTCGPVPILVSSDHPESGPAVDAICRRHPDVFHWPNPDRIGHTGGDVGAFFKGVVWGAARGLRVVAKLSQRMVITRPRWLPDGAADLLASGLPLASRRCRGREVFDLRTEACLLDVARWNRPDVLARIVPRRYWHDLPHGLAAETILNRVLIDLLGGVYWPWGLFTEDRYERRDGVVWHGPNPRADYDALAARFGVTLPADLHTDGWQRELAAGTYLYG